MKYRVVAGFISASVIAAALSGCGKKGAQETEPQSLVVSDMEVVVETEAQSAEPTAAETESQGLIIEEAEALEIDLSDELDGETGSSEEMIEEEAVIEEGEDAQTVRLENRKDFAKKPGAGEEQTKETQAETSAQAMTKPGSETQQETPKETQQETKKPANSTGKKTQEETQKKETQKRETQKSETESKKSAGVSTTAKDEVQPMIPAVTRPETEEKTERQTETERQIETDAPKRQTELQTETESETQTGTESESGTESERKVQGKRTASPVSETRLKTETESETEKETESETETETEMEAETETESETESEFEEGIRIVSDTVKVRQQPNTNATQVASLSAGMRVYAVGESEDWTQVLFESAEGLEEGYIRTEYLNGADNLYAVKETINVRKSPSTDAEKIGQLIAADNVLVLGQEADGWVKIRYTGESDDQEAYVMQEYLEKAEIDEAGNTRLLELVEQRKQAEAQETEAGAEQTTETDTDAERANESESGEDSAEDATENPEAEEEEKTEAGAGATLEPGVCTVIDYHVNVREQPSTDAGIKASLSDGMTVYAVETDGGWTKIYFESADGVDEGYMKTEYLKKFESDDARIAQLARAKMQETDSEDRQADAADTETPDETAETAETTGTQASTESEESVETQSQEPAGDDGQAMTETADESETQTERDAQTEAEPQTESETQTEATTEANAALTLDEGIESQFELLDGLFSEAQNVGIIYSSENKDAKTQIENYEKFAATYGFELTVKEIESDLDIELAASELVDSVDSVFCLDDALVDELMQTVCAYADEMGIPVIGTKQSHIDSGCLAAYKGGKLLWNADKAVELGLSSEAPTFE